MPAMSRFEAAFCRSAPWRSVTRTLVLPWALQGFTPEGDVLEIGAGSGAMAEQLLAAFPAVTVTATDVDDEMVEAIATRLARFAGRAGARQADATALPFPDGSFDAVLSWVMLHHTVEWEKALDEATRVVRPGGHVVGYDLLSTWPLRRLHDGHGGQHRMMRLGELRDHVASLPADPVRLAPTLGGVAVRFVLRRRAES